MFRMLKERKAVDNYARKFILQGELLSNNILFKGKMEAIIFCYEYSRYYNKILFRKFADELVDSLCQRLINTEKIGFSNGLSGIAWAFTYLDYNCYLTCDLCDLLLDIDKVIMQRDPRRFNDLSFDNGFEGVLYYINTRLIYARDKSQRLPFDKMYMNDLISAISSNSYSAMRGDQIKLFTNILHDKKVNYNFEIGINQLNFHKCLFNL